MARASVARFPFFVAGPQQICGSAGHRNECNELMNSLLNFFLTGDTFHHYSEDSQ